MKVYYEKEDKIKEINEAELNQLVSTPIDFCDMVLKLKEKGIFVVASLEELSQKVNRYNNMLISEINEATEESILFNIGMSVDDLLDEDFERMDKYKTLIYPTIKGSESIGLYIE